MPEGCDLFKDIKVGDSLGDPDEDGVLLEKLVVEDAGTGGELFQGNNDVNLELGDLGFDVLIESYDSSEPYDASRVCPSSCISRLRDLGIGCDSIALIG